MKPQGKKYKLVLKWLDAATEAATRCHDLYQSDDEGDKNEFLFQRDLLKSAMSNVYDWMDEDE